MFSHITSPTLLVPIVLHILRLARFPTLAGLERLHLQLFFCSFKFGSFQFHLRDLEFVLDICPSRFR